MRCKLLILLLVLASACTAREADSVAEIQPAILTASLDSNAVVGVFGNEPMTSLDVIEELQSWKAAETERLQHAARVRELRLWVVIAFLLAILVSVIWFFITRKVLNEKLLQEEKAENERLMSIAEDLQGKLSTRAEKSRDTRLLERLCEQYYIYEGTDNLQPKILREVKTVIEGLRKNPKELEKTVDRDGIVTALRSQFPRLKEEDVQLFCYLASGFSTTTISTLMEKDKQYIYNRVYRLRGRISESDAPDKERFLGVIR